MGEVQIFLKDRDGMEGIYKEGNQYSLKNTKNSESN